MSNSRAGKGRSSSDKVPKTCCLKVNSWPISKSEEARLYEQENERRALAHAEDVETVEAEHESAASTSSPRTLAPRRRTESATDALVEAPAFQIATETLRNNALTDSEEAYIGTRDWR